MVIVSSDRPQRRTSLATRNTTSQSITISSSFKTMFGGHSLAIFALLFLHSNEADAAKDLKLLFVGNSLTFVNDLPGLVDKLSKSPQSPIRTSSTQSTAGAATFEDHCDDQRVNTMNVIPETKADFVILQEQSAGYFWLGPEFLPEYGQYYPNKSSTTGKTFELYPTRLVKATEAAGGTAIFFMTWRDIDDMPDWQEGSQTELADDFTYVSAFEKSMCAPCGNAALLNYKEWGTDIYLGGSDPIHPSLMQQYTNACVFYATLTGLSPIGLNDAGTGLGASYNLTKLQEHAWQAYTAFRGINEPLCTHEFCIRFMDESGSLTPIPAPGPTPPSHDDDDGTGPNEDCYHIGGYGKPAALEDCALKEGCVWHPAITTGACEPPSVCQSPTNAASCRAASSDCFWNTYDNRCLNETAQKTGSLSPCFAYASESTCNSETVASCKWLVTTSVGYCTQKSGSDDDELNDDDDKIEDECTTLTSSHACSLVTGCAWQPGEDNGFCDKYSKCYGAKDPASCSALAAAGCAWDIPEKLCGNESAMADPTPSPCWSFPAQISCEIRGGKQCSWVPMVTPGNCYRKVTTPAPGHVYPIAPGQYDCARVNVSDPVSCTSFCEQHGLVGAVSPPGIEGYGPNCCCHAVAAAASTLFAARMSRSVVASVSADAKCCTIAEPVYDASGSMVRPTSGVCSGEENTKCGQSMLATSAKCSDVQKKASALCNPIAPAGSVNYTACTATYDCVHAGMGDLFDECCGCLVLTAHQLGLGDLNIDCMQA